MHLNLYLCENRVYIVLFKPISVPVYAIYINHTFSDPKSEENLDQDFFHRVFCSSLDHIWKVFDDNIE